MWTVFIGSFSLAFLYGICRFIQWCSDTHQAANRSVREDLNDTDIMLWDDCWPGMVNTGGIIDKYV